MANDYVVAIVGRPNVGKSALFNRMVSSDASIVHKSSGVTRDRLYGTCRWRGQEFTVVDTGGLDLVSRDDMVEAIKFQVEQALQESDVLVFVVDVRAGLTAEDIEVAQSLRTTGKPLLIVANKADVREQDEKALEFYRLGFPAVLPVSAAHGLGVGDLLDRLVEIKDDLRAGLAADRQRGDAARGEGTDPEPVPPIRIAVAGRPNVGKSSLVNALLGRLRMTVSTRPGTTVDAVDTPIVWEGTRFVLVDTAGLRRPKLIGEKLEELSVARSLSAIRRSDVAVLMVDGSGSLSAQERRIAGFVRRNSVASVIVVNKTDLAFEGDVSENQYRHAVLYQCRPIAYSSVLFTSCVTGKGVDKVLPEITRVYQEYGKRIETAVLNRFLMEVTELNRPPKRAKFFYGTQVGQKPPRIVFFVRDPKSVTAMYQRYLEGQLRSRFGFQGTPIVMEFRERERIKRS